MQDERLNQCHEGALEVTIEGKGTKKIDAQPFEPLWSLIGQVDMLLGFASGTVVCVSTDSHQYELVEYNKEENRLVVRKKS